MSDDVRGDRKRAKARRTIRGELSESQRKSPRQLGCTWKEHVEGGHHAPFRAHRPGDQERSVALCDEMLLQQQKQYAGEVVAVQMAEEDCIDAPRVDGKAAHCDERGGTAVEQAGAAFGSDHEATLKPASAPERIATSENPNSHPVHS